MSAPHPSSWKPSDSASGPGGAFASRRTFLTGTAALGAAAAWACRPGPARAATLAATTPTAPAAGGATVTAQNWVDGRTLDVTINSPALGTTTTTRLLVPSGWQPGSSKTWPVLYLLHGLGGDHTNWTTLTDLASLTSGVDVLVVMPDGGQAGFYSNWWNLGAGGTPEWQTFHLNELRQILESGYGAGTDRVIAGLSMGGFGALSYAALNPGMFRAAAAYSGVIDTTYSGSTLINGPTLIETSLAQKGYLPQNLWGDPVVNAQIWAAHNPYALADHLTGIPLFVSAGNGQPGPLDPPGTAPDYLTEPLVEAMSQAFAAKVQALGGTVTTDFYGAGIHNWPEWQQELHRSFPMLMNALGVPTG